MKTYKITNLEAVPRPLAKHLIWKKY